MNLFKSTLCILLLVSSCLLQAQIGVDRNGQVSKQPRRAVSGVNTDSLGFNRNNESRPADSLKVFVPTIHDYLVGLENQPTNPIDTALTIQSFYEQNFLQKDLFAKMPFPNLGQTYNPLELETFTPALFTVTGKATNLINAEDARYYDVKTPVTEFIYENGVREGQYLSTTFTHSPNKQWNYAIRYRGLRSQGRFQRQLASNNSLVINLSHISKNERYKTWLSYISNNIDNQENGGIDSLGIIAFSENDPDFSDRDRLELNLQDAQTFWDDRRYRWGQEWGIVRKIAADDSAKYSYPIAIQNVFDFKTQDYRYEEAAPESFYESEIVQDRRSNEKQFTTLSNTTSLKFRITPDFQVNGGLKYERIELAYDSLLQVNPQFTVPQAIEDNLISILGNVRYQWKDKFKLKGEVEFTRGELFQNQYLMKGTLQTSVIPGYDIEAGLQLNSRYPSLNLVFNQSFYEDFNYYNTQFENQETQEIFFNISSQKYATKLFGQFTNTTNFTYITHDLQPTQLDGSLTYFKIGVDNHFQWKKFHAQTRIQYQQVTENAFALPLPDFVARTTWYYQNKWFNNAATIQTGFNVNYFSKFNSREFFPVLNEFSLQDPNNTREIGNYPMLDLFFNMKVKRMRMYLRTENINSFFMRGDYFSTPNQPFRDFKIQLGVRWFLFT